MNELHDALLNLQTAAIRTMIVVGLSGAGLALAWALLKTLFDRLEGR
jgi:hypothetical protein